MPLPSELIEKLADAGARRELGRLLDGLAGVNAWRVERGVWVPAWTGLTVVGTPAYAGYFTRLDRLVKVSVVITAGGANTTASTYGTTLINNLPFRSLHLDVLHAVVGVNGGGGVGQIGGISAYPPTWGATNSDVEIGMVYEVG
jgi:hypothetical protein